MNWLEAGQTKNPLMIFLHGFPDTAHIWQKQIQHFSKTHHIIAPFLRGVGKSEYSYLPNRMTVAAIVKDIEQLVKAVKPDLSQKIIICGHDIGTVFAWHLAAAFDTHLKALIIINGAHDLQFAKRLVSNTSQALKSWYVYFFFLPLLPELMLKFLPLSLKSSLFTKLGADKSQIAKSLSDSPKLVTLYKSILFDCMQQILGFKPIPKITAPLLSISALSDPFVEVSSKHELQPFAQNITIKIFEGKHWIQFENSDLINQAISDFLEKL